MAILIFILGYITYEPKKSALHPNRRTRLVWNLLKRFDTSTSWCVQKLIPTQHRSINQCIAAMFPPILGDYFRIGTSITIWFSSSGSFIGIYNHDSWAVGFLILMCNHSSQISKKWFWSALCFPSPPHFGDVALVANHPKRDLSVGGNNLLESSQNCRKSGRKTWLTSDKLFFGVVIRCWQKI